jgi:tetratricopeptide (TPR) repeat protein
MRWSLGVGGLLAGAVALALVLGVPSPRGGAKAGALWLTGAPTRRIEARVSYPAADAHRPYETLRAERPTPPPPAPLQELARLEEAGDAHGIAAAYLLRGASEQAATWLERAGASPDVDSDRAVLALDRGQPTEALALLERVLRQHPRHAQALWNRGLVMRALDLPALEAESFEAVAALGEPGWADEARARAEALRTRLRTAQEGWQRLRNECDPFVEGTGSLPREYVRQWPGFLRLCLYDAVRAAPTPERLKALWPMAETLDTYFGGTALRDAIRWAETRDFRQRAPLAKLYMHVFRKQPIPGGLPAYLERLRRAGEQDILMGTLVLTRTVLEHLDEYRELVARTKDPWFLLLEDDERARSAMGKGALQEAERILLSALERCAARPLYYRCALLEKQLTHLYREMHRPAEGFQHALEARRQLQAENATGPEPWFLLELGQLARFRDQPPLARAYLNEALARVPEDCEVRRFVHENNAAIYQGELAFPEARRELDRVRECPGPLTPVGIQVLADLARQRPAPGDAPWLAESMEALRRPGAMEPGALLVVSHHEARFTLERDRAAGEALLRKVIAEAARLPKWNADARKARAYAYTALLLAAGRAGEHEAALALFGEELGGALPSRCVLGVTMDDERTLVLARGPEGRLLGRYDASRTTPLGGEARGLVPEEVITALRGCERVAVVARPPLHGRAGLLPPDMAWSFFTPKPERGLAPTLPARHLVIADVQAPPQFQLARLGAWGKAPPGSLVVSGAQATPSRVLEEMARATEIEAHVHGVINLAVSDASFLVLSPEPAGRYALTADEVRERRLEGAPLVILAACRAAHTAPTLHEPFSLPGAFIQAGARTVLAATVDIPDTEAGAFFDAVRERIRSGQPAANALRDVRVRWLQDNPSSWVRSVLVFD